MLAFKAYVDEQSGCVVCKACSSCGMNGFPFQKLPQEVAMRMKENVHVSGRSKRAF